MADKTPPKAIIILDGIFIGGDDEDLKYMMLVEQGDHVWRKATGKDLAQCAEAFPMFFKALREGSWEDE